MIEVFNDLIGEVFDVAKNISLMAEDIDLYIRCIERAEIIAESQIEEYWQEEEAQYIDVILVIA